MLGGEKHLPAMSVVFLRLAVAGVFVFSTTAETPAEQKARVQRIEDSVLAPCCYTQPVSRHQSEIAVKMRIEISKWVAEGKTDQEILDTYAQQYGAKVLVDPRTIPGWWTPWVPWLVAVFTVIFGFWLLRRWRTRISPPAPLSPSLDGAVLPDLDDDE